MLIYEKDNKLNISFENNMEDTDIEIGKDEVKIGEATISENNVLPTPTNEDVGKVPTVQEDGSYALANAGGGSEPFVVTFSGTTENDNALCDKTWEEIYNAHTTGNTIICRWISSDIGMDYIYAMPQFHYDNRANDWTIMQCSAFYNVIDVWNETKNNFESPYMFCAFISATTIEAHAGRISAS